MSDAEDALALESAVSACELLARSVRGSCGSSDDAAGSVSPIHFVVRDGDSMMPMPARAIVYPTMGTAKPDFKSDGLTASVLAPGVIGSPEGVLLVSGDGTVGVPAGTYDLWLLQDSNTSW